MGGGQQLKATEVGRSIFSLGLINDCAVNTSTAMLDMNLPILKGHIVLSIQSEARATNTIGAVTQMIYDNWKNVG